MTETKSKGLFAPAFVTIFLIVHCGNAQAVSQTSAVAQRTDMRDPRLSVVAQISNKDTNVGGAPERRQSMIDLVPPPKGLVITEGPPVGKKRKDGGVPKGISQDKHGNQVEIAPLARRASPSNGAQEVTGKSSGTSATKRQKPAPGLTPTLNKPKLIEDNGSSLGG